MCRSHFAQCNNNCPPSQGSNARELTKGIPHFQKCSLLEIRHVVNMYPVTVLELKLHNNTDTFCFNTSCIGAVKSNYMYASID